MQVYFLLRVSFFFGCLHTRRKTTLPLEQNQVSTCISETKSSLQVDNPIFKHLKNQTFLVWCLACKMLTYLTHLNMISLTLPTTSPAWLSNLSPPNIKIVVKHSYWVEVSVLFADSFFFS